MDLAVECSVWAGPDQSSVRDNHCPKALKAKSACRRDRRRRPLSRKAPTRRRQSSAARPQKRRLGWDRGSQRRLQWLFSRIRYPRVGYRHRYRRGSWDLRGDRPGRAALASTTWMRSNPDPAWACSAPDRESKSVARFPRPLAPYAVSRCSLSLTRSRYRATTLPRAKSGRPDRTLAATRI